MIEDDHVLFAPAKARNRAEIVSIKQVPGNIRAALGSNQWAINQFRCCINDDGWQFRQVKQSTSIHARCEMLPQRTYQGRYPTVILSAIHPNRKVSSRLDLRNQRFKARIRIG